MTCRFSVGDVVQLNSGGPKMTVVVIVSGSAVRVHYFTVQGEKQTSILPVRTLRKVDDAAA